LVLSGWRVGPIVDLTLGCFFGQPIFLLNLANQLVVLAGNLIKVIIGQLAPGSGTGDELVDLMNCARQRACSMPRCLKGQLEGGTS
jgi:hypothetical protein